MNAYFCGVDYSTKAVDVALLRGREIVLLEEHRLGRDLGPQIGVMARAIEHVCEAAGGPCPIFMEAMWMRVEQSAGAQELHKIPTRVETLAVAAGFTVTYVPINSWRATILGNGRLEAGKAKQAAIDHVKRLFPGQPLASHNAADSVCLALYGQAIARREALVAR